MTARVRGIVTGGLLAVWLGLLAPAPRAAAAEGIRFMDSVLAALRLAKAEKKVTVVYFTAGWCPWCLKMQTTTLANRSVLPLAKRFVWAKVDFGAQPEIAAAFNVRTLPHLTLLNVKGDTLAGVSGYQTHGQLIKLLRQHVNDAEKVGRLREQIANTLKQLKSATDRKSVTKVVEMLARPKRDGRGQLLDGLSKLPRTHWPHLVTLMTDAKIAIRAAAATALATATRADLPFDPFADATTRRDQIKAWRTWLAKHPATRPAALPSPK